MLYCFALLSDTCDGYRIDAIFPCGTEGMFTPARDRRLRDFRASKKWSALALYLKEPDAIVFFFLKRGRALGFN